MACILVRSHFGISMILAANTDIWCLNLRPDPALRFILRQSVPEFGLKVAFFHIRDIVSQLQLNLLANSLKVPNGKVPFARTRTSKFCKISFLCTSVKYGFFVVLAFSELLFVVDIGIFRVPGCQKFNRYPDTYPDNNLPRISTPKKVFLLNYKEFVCGAPWKIKFLHSWKLTLF